MGLEAVSMLVYDDLALFAEMVETVATCVIARSLPRWRQAFSSSMR